MRGSLATSAFTKSTVSVIAATRSSNRSLGSEQISTKVMSPVTTPIPLGVCRYA